MAKVDDKPEYITRYFCTVEELARRNLPCGDTFATEDELRLHLNTHHGGQMVRMFLDKTTGWKKTYRLVEEERPHA